MKLILLLLLSFAAILPAQQIVRSFDAPDSGISGLAYCDNTLYAVGSISSTVYELDEMSGSVTASWTVSTISGHVYKYTTSGSYQGTADVLC